MTMETDQLKSRLQQLPLRPMLAFIARCARRLPPACIPTAASSSTEFENAIALLERHASTMEMCENPHDAATAVANARRLLDAALSEARVATSDLMQSHVAATESIVRAARPTVPGPMDEIAKQRDSALTEYRAAAQHARELAQDFEADKIKAAQQALHKAERSAAKTAQSAVLAYHEVHHTASHAAGAVVDALTTVQPASASVLAGEIEALARLAGEPSNDRALGPAIDPTEQGPLGAYWPGGSTSFCHPIEGSRAERADAEIRPHPPRHSAAHSDATVENRFDRAAKLVIRLAHALGKFNAACSVPESPGLPSPKSESSNR